MPNKVLKLYYHSLETASSSCMSFFQSGTPHRYGWFRFCMSSQHEIWSRNWSLPWSNW